MLKLRPIEWFLIEFAMYTFIWLLSDYIGTLVSLVFIFIFTALLIVAGIAELIEPSKVPKSYYLFMMVSILAPICAGAVFLGIIGGDLQWLKTPFSN